MSNAVKKVTLLTRIKDAIRAFKGEYKAPAIRFGIDVRRCNECEHTGNRPDILYLCDGVSCDRHGEIGHCGGGQSGECKHTTDIRHARNFTYDPEFGYYKENDNKEEV